MEKFKIGGKITLEDNISYRIIDILKYKDRDYLFCCTIQKPIEPKLLECKEENGEILVALEEDPRISFEIAKKIINNKNN